MNFADILQYTIIEVGSYALHLGQVFYALFILVTARLLWLFLQRAFLKGFFRKRKVDVGRQFAISTIIKYILYTVAILWALQSLGIHLSVLWGGAAALLVGIGLGLQQTFNDLISGIILLSEATVEVGDVVSVDGIVGTVKDIGIRTSKVETRDDITIIIPNSKLVVDNVINWSHNDTPTRFQVVVGVAYHSDIELVTILLLQAAQDHPDILKYPAPKIKFNDFGSSSLDFELHFFSNEFLKIEFVKSDIRYKIMTLFRQHKIEIPFPQRDLWLKNAEMLFPIRPNEQTQEQLT